MKSKIINSKNKYSDDMNIYELIINTSIEGWSEYIVTNKLSKLKKHIISRDLVLEEGLNELFKDFDNENSNKWISKVETFKVKGCISVTLTQLNWWIDSVKIL